MGMILSAGRRIEVAEEFLDKAQTLAARTIYQHTGIVSGYFFREIAESRGGRQIDTAENAGNYDTINFPLEGGILIIERARVKTGKDGNSCVGHRVSYVGDSVCDEEILLYLTDLVKEDRLRAKEEAMQIVERLYADWREPWKWNVNWRKEYKHLFEELGV